MSLVEIFQVWGTNVWLYGGVFIIVLSVLVFVHEWGHYIVARLCGVRVEEFSIGFGRELGGFKDKAGTRWKFSLIPMGGYVKMFGDVDPASAKHEDAVQDPVTGKKRDFTTAELGEAFFAKPVWKRAAIVVAGPAVNYIFAILVLAALFMINGQPVTPPSAAAVVVGSSADKNGFMPHDVVLSIDGDPVVNFEDIRREMMISLDQKKHFVVQRDGKTIDIYAQPEKITLEDHFGFMHSRGLLGLIGPQYAVSIKNIREVDGVAFAEGRDEAVRKALLARMGKRFSVKVEQGEKTDQLLIQPFADFNAALKKNDPAAPGYGILYIANTKGSVFIRSTPATALADSLKQTWVITQGTLEALGQMVVGTRSPTELGGVIRMGALAGDMAQQGVVAVILFMALLSINLGLINLFPVPMLDGGHLLFYAVEAVCGRPIPDRIQEYAFRFGLVFLVAIMVFANLNDILQLVL